MSDRPDAAGAKAGPNLRGLTAADTKGARKRPRIPPWDPPFCGDIGMEVRRDGSWAYQGSPIGRLPLVKLFASVMRREADAFFLVTPVEKVSLVVEDAPFIAVAMQVDGDGAGQTLHFTTNLGDEATAGDAHPLRAGRSDGAEAPALYVDIRGGLEARINRAVYYDLVERAVHADIEGASYFGVWSGGRFFPFGRSDEVNV
ncbi:MAG: DUF1285 domain-containing protein [Pseudomonadota bacterium]